MPLNTRQPDSKIHQLEWKSIDPAGCRHLFKAGGDDMLLVLTPQSMHLFKADDAGDF